MLQMHRLPDLRVAIKSLGGLTLLDEQQDVLGSDEVNPFDLDYLKITRQYLLCYWSLVNLLNESAKHGALTADLKDDGFAPRLATLYYKYSSPEYSGRFKFLDQIVQIVQANILYMQKIISIARENLNE